MDIEKNYVKALHDTLERLNRAAENTAAKAHHLPPGREREMLVHQWALRQGEVRGIQMALDML